MYFSFYLQWDVGSSPSVERWCILLSSSSVVRRCISLSTSSGTLVVRLQWNVGVFCYLHRQWYVDELSFLYHQWYGGISLHTFSGTLVCVIVSGTAVHLFHRQWYVDELSLFYIISGTVVYFFMPSVERWYVLSLV